MAKISMLELTDVQKLELVKAYATDKANYNNIASIKALSASQKGATTSTISLSTAYKGLAASIGITTTQLTVLLGALAAVGAGAIAISKYNQYIKEQNDNARESAKAISDQNKSLDENIKKIQELRGKLDDANISESEAYDIKTQLYEIQKQLIETYGEEAEGLRLVNGEITTQIDKLRTLSKEKAIEWQRNNKDAIKRATNEMTQERKLQVGYETGLSKELFQSQVAELQKIVSKYESQGLSMNVTEDINNRNALQYTIDFTGDVTQAEKVLDEFSKEVQKTSHDLGADNNVLLENVVRSSSDILKQQGSIIENNIDSYRTNLQAEIAQAGNIDVDGRTYNQNKVYGDYLASVEEYNKALATGNGIDDAKKQYENLLIIINEIIAKRPDFEYLFNPDVVGLNQTAIDRNNFASILDTSSFYKAKTEIINGLQDVDLETNNMSEDQIDAFNTLVKAGDDYGLSLEDVISLLKEMGVILDEVADKPDNVKSPFSKSEMISAINGMSEGFEALDKIMNSQKGKNPFDFSLLDDKKFNDNFNIDALKDEYSAFVETISNSPKDVNACKDAYDNLITSWIKSKGILDGISEETASVTEAMLKNMGVANSDVLVQEALTKAKANSAYESNNLSNATSQEIIGLINESGATDEARESFGLYIAQKMVAEAAIDTSGDISALANVVSSLGLATSAWQRYYATKQRMAQITADPNFVSYEEDGSVVSKDTVLAQYSKIAEYSLKEYAQELEDKAQKASYSGGNKSNSSSGSGSGSKKEPKELKEEFNWLQRLDEYYQKQHDIQSKIAEDETASYSERIAALKEMTNLDKERMGSATKTASEYLNKWNEIKEQLDPKYISKIMYGDISDEEITALEDSDLADQIELIKQGIDYYDKWQDAEEKKLELQEECTDRLREELELQQELIQAQQEMLQSEMDIVQSKIDYIEASGGIVTAGYYEEQIRLSKQISDSYEDQIDNLRKQQEMVKDESAEYYSLESQINDCEKAIIECKTQQAEWNEAIKRLPVERMQKYINMLKAIKQELEDFLDYQETIGQPTTKDQFQQLIEINQEQIESLQKQAEELQGLLGDYKYGSEKFNDVANELSDIQNETASLVNQMQEYNQEILNIPVNKLEKVNEELERYSSILSGVMDDYNSALNAVTNLVDKQVESLEDLKEQTEKTYQDQIDPLQEQLDLLEKTNEARSVELELEQAKYDLERAQNQKTTKVVRNGQIQYEANESDIRDTKEKLQDAEFNKLKYDIQSQIDYLEEQRDKINEGYDDEIDRLNDISDKWEKIRKDAEAYADTLKADDILGSNWQDRVLSGNDDDIYNMFKNLYESTNQQQVQVDEQIASNERIVEMMQVFIERFTDGSMTYEQALSGITELAESMNQGYTALEQLNGMLDIDGIENLAGIAGSVENQINESVSMLAEYIDVAKVNNDAIAEYTSTWEEMSQMIDEQLKALKEAAEALEKWVAEQKYNRNSYSSDGDGGGWSGSGVTSNGVYDAESHSYSNPGHSNAGGEAPSSANDDQDEDDGPGVHHGGSMAGYLGDGNSEIKRLRDIQFLCNEDLSPDEVLIKGLKDEICLTKEEQMRLIGNFNAMSIPNLVPVDTSRLVPVNNSRTNEVTINMGDINLPDVRDVDGFAREMGSRFNLIIGQELGKR